MSVPIVGMMLILAVVLILILVINKDVLKRALNRVQWLNKLKIQMFNYCICEYDNSGKYFIRKGRFFRKYFNQHHTYLEWRWATIDRFKKEITRNYDNPLYKNINAVGKAWDEHILHKTANEKVIYVVNDDE